MHSPKKDKKYNQNWSNNYISLNHMNKVHNFTFSSANKISWVYKNS